MLSFNYHKVGKGVAIVIKVALTNGYKVYDEGPVNPISEELNLEPKVELEEDPEEELDDGLDM